MLHYTLKRESNGSVTIEVKMMFDRVDDAIVAVTELEKLTACTSIDNELLPFLKDGQLLGAVKYYKDKTGLGLKESKEYCDKLRDKFRAMGLIAKD